MVDDVTERLIRAGLDPAGAAPAPNVAMVPMGMPDGTQREVPAEVGTYFAVVNLANMFQQMMVRLDGIHHHLAARAHPRSEEHATCNVCIAVDMARELAAEQKKTEEEQKTAEEDKDEAE